LPKELQELLKNLEDKILRDEWVP